MKSFINWIGGLFSSESKVSSKRFMGIMLLSWACGMGTYYIIEIQGGGEESSSTASLLEFAIVSAVSLGVGGTAAESLKRKVRNDK